MRRMWPLVKPALDLEDREGRRIQAKSQHVPQHLRRGTAEKKCESGARGDVIGGLPGDRSGDYPRHEDRKTMEVQNRRSYRRTSFEKEPRGKAGWESRSQKTESLQANHHELF